MVMVASPQSFIHHGAQSDPGKPQIYKRRLHTTHELSSQTRKGVVVAGSVQALGHQ